jgi:hypothetical protein
MKYNHVIRVKSSMKVMIYLLPVLEMTGKGPHKSECMSYNGCVVLVVRVFGILVQVDLPSMQDG